MKQARHLGVYGIVIQDGKLLVIRKGRGPYIGLFDLPGGSMEHGETIEETLKREMMEEVRAEVKSAELVCNMTNIARWVDGEIATETHHIGLYYLVWLMPGYTLREEADGHDSEGALWVDLVALKQEQISPIGWNALKKSGLV